MKKVSIILFFCIPLVSGTAQEKTSFFSPYTVSISADTGLMFGSSDESVYDPGTESKLSELTWGISPIFYYGVSARFFNTEKLPPFSIFSALSLKAGLNFIPNGFLKDYDWEAGELVNYSEHDSRSENAFFLDFTIGASWRIAGILLLKPYLGVSYMDITWIATDGYYHYPPTEAAPKIPMTGPLISYMQNWIMVYPGIAITFPFRNFMFNAAFQASPLIFYYGNDNHLQLINNTNGQLSNYKDTANFGLYIEPALSVSYTFAPRFTLTLDLSYRYQETARGESVARVTGDSQAVTSTPYTLDTPVAAGIQFFRAGLSAHVSF